MEDHVTTKDQLAQWFDEGVTRKADYMIIVRDMFEKSVEPVYVSNGGERTIHDVAQGYENDEKMTRVLEVYDVHGDRDAKLMSTHVGYSAAHHQRDDGPRGEADGDTDHAGIFGLEDGPYGAANRRHHRAAG
jgi:hypothetical protein